MHAVIMAGGSGTRFWPASRERLPKQFLSITSHLTLFEETFERVAPLAGSRPVWAVVNRLHEPLTAQLLQSRNVQILAEPVGRNTAPAIGLAAIHLRQTDALLPMVVLPSDQFVSDPAAFRELLGAAGDFIQKGGIATIGIQPTRPETGYGYIKAGSERGTVQGHTAFAVERFVEKPDFETACEYLKDAAFSWNSGIFLFTAETILTEIKVCLPNLYEQLCEIEQTIGTAAYPETLAEVFARMEPISIDYGVMEKTTAPISVFRANFGWSDVGSWEALYELRQPEADAAGNLALGDTVVVDSSNNLVFSNTGRVVTLLDVENLVVVDTPDAVLVARKNRSQDVKQFPAHFRKTNREGLW